MYNKILLALDKSEYSQKAVEHVKEIAKKFGAQVLLLHSYKIPVDLTDKAILYNLSDDSVKKIEDNMNKHYQEFLDRAKKEIEDAGISCQTVLKKGKAGPNIVETSKKEGCDFIVLGSRGLGATKSVFLGSVSSYVLHHIDKPLLVVY